VLERESEETKEAESSVAALRRQVASQREAIAALDADIEQYRARVANLRRGQFLLLTSIISRTRRPPTFEHHQSEKWNGKR
jgi:cell division protein FtsB